MTNVLCDVIPVNVGGTSVVSFAFLSLYLVIASAFDCLFHVEHTGSGTIAWSSSTVCFSCILGVLTSTR